MDVTPTQDLVMEVLAARYRLGERIWPFDTAVRPALRALEAHGLIGWKAGVTRGVCNAWLTETGRALYLDSTYAIPTSWPCACGRITLSEGIREVLSAPEHVMHRRDGCGPGAWQPWT